MLTSVWKVLKFCINSGYRSRQNALSTQKGAVHQLDTKTFPDRYPTLFKTCQDYLGQENNTTILSFGCSSGDEVYSLSKYFPQAKIVGTDLNKRSLSIAKNKFNLPHLTFVYNEGSNVTQLGPYGAIFCMAVLQKSELAGVHDSSKIYPFTKFEEQLKVLDEMLTVGGVLTIANTNYRFSDSSIAYKYRNLPSQRVVHDVPLKFSKDGQRLKNEKYLEFIFIKEQ